jgi:hypothetical protein
MSELPTIGEYLSAVNPSIDGIVIYEYTDTPEYEWLVVTKSLNGTNEAIYTTNYLSNYDFGESFGYYVPANAYVVLAPIDTSILTTQDFNDYYTNYYTLVSNNTDIKKNHTYKFYLIPANQGIADISGYEITNIMNYNESIDLTTQTPYTGETNIDIPLLSGPIFVDTTLYPINSYSTQRVNKAFDSKDTTTRVILQKVSETIYEDTINNPNTFFPKFRSYRDYLAYKSSLALRNFIKNNS